VDWLTGYFKQYRGKGPAIGAGYIDGRQDDDGVGGVHGIGKGQDQDHTHDHRQAGQHSR